MRPAKTQISGGVRPVWSESSLCAQWVAKYPSFNHADSEDSDQIGRMPRLIWVFAGRECHFVGFVMRRLIFVASFSMIRVKMSQLIKYFFELILKAYAWGVPNRTAILQDWTHQSFIYCLFYILWTSLNISYQEAKGPMSLNANLINVCIASQIICDSDAKTLDTFYIFEHHFRQSIWSMDRFAPFPCYLHHIAFDRLKSHTPFPCSTSQFINIFLKFQCVLCILCIDNKHSYPHKVLFQNQCLSWYH